MENEEEEAIYEGISETLASTNQHLSNIQSRKLPPPPLQSQLPRQGTRAPYPLPQDHVGEQYMTSIN